MKIFSACQALTDEELIRKYTALYGTAPHSTIRTRRRELEAEGRIVNANVPGVVQATGRACRTFMLVVS